MFHLPELPDLLVLLAVALIFLGPSRLPGAGKALGEGIRNFKEALSGEPKKEEKKEEELPKT